MSKSTADFSVQATVILDYEGSDQCSKLLVSLSAVRAVGERLWTASDEGRSLECLKQFGDGYRLEHSFTLDRFFKDLPGRQEGREVDEADIEALDVSGYRLWISGSHCRVRRIPKPDRKGKPENADRHVGKALDRRIRDRPSRHLLGAITLTADGNALAKPGKALPFVGNKSIRDHLLESPYLAPFSNLPSKENGLDVEGVCEFEGQLLVGLRGPLIDNIAVIASISLNRRFRIRESKTRLNFVDLEGLGIRDLFIANDGVMILAGPVSKANGPFRLFHWTPDSSNLVQDAKVAFEWPSSSEHPGGICRLSRGGRDGLLVLYDNPNPGRINGTRYTADWLGI